MRLVVFILIFSTFFANNINSQGENDYVGINSEISFNLFDKNEIELWTIRPILSFNRQKMQYSAGAVISELHVENGYREDFKIKAFTGITLTAKRYMNIVKKHRAYYFANLTYLGYRSAERLEYNYGTSSVRLHPDYERNKIRIFQPIFGTGMEYRWFNAITFSIDFGFGWCFRKFIYERDYSDDYPTNVSSFIGQFKLGLGYYF